MDGTFPRCYYCPEPEFSPAARKAKISGKVVLRAVITEQGWVAGIRLVQPAGFGLDQQAIQVVSNYRFKPARVEGRPVATVMNVEIYFTRSD